MPHLLLICLFVIFALVAPASVPAQTPPVADAPDRVRAISDGDTLTLESGITVRLVGIQAPKLALGRRGFEDWPLAQQARQTLLELTRDQAIILRPGDTARDRHGRTLAHLYRAPDGLWIQGEMLRRGMARVYTFRDNRAQIGEMLALERAARAARRGIWAHEFYAVRRPGNLHGLQDSFQLVEGRVLKFAKISDYIFLNFGPDYKTDFTAVIGRRDWPHFAAAGIDPQIYAGKNLRVRGWMESWNGPMLRISHPEQIEIME